MKRWTAVILSVFLTFQMAGCAGTPRTSSADNNISGAASVNGEQITLTGSSAQSVYGVETPATDDQEVFTQTRVLSSNTEEMRAVWLAYVNYENWIKNATKAQFTTNMKKVMENISASGFNTLFFQVRPFGDALYESDYFPWSRYLTGTEGKNPGYDPLEITCDLAKEYNIQVEAWINPYRVRTDSTPMASDNQAKIWNEQGSRAVVAWNGGLYYNPASAEARKLITNGVVEIVKNYDVSGVHFDDYFYPTTDMAFDAADYKASGSKLSQADWRRENVDKLVKQVYAAVKKVDATCLFGISPQGNLQINYDGQFINVKKWLSEDGFIDYICPQIYYGFNNKVAFAETVKAWDKLIQNDVELHIGIAAYKLGALDKWAGSAGQNEWIGTKDLLARMVKTARGASNYGGVALYSYDSLYATGTSQVKNERSNLEKVFR